MLLREEQLISLFEGEIGLETDVEWQEDAEVGKSSDISDLKGADPLQDTSVLVHHFTLLKVEAITGELRRHLHERLIEIGRMIDVLLKLEESVHWRSEELRMAQPISHILVLLLWLDGDIVLVPLSVVVIVRNWPVQSFLLPLHDVFELGLLVPGRVGDKPILVLEGPLGFFGKISPWESEIRQFRSNGSVWVEIGVNTRNA